MIHWIMAVRCIFQASKDSEAQKYKSRNITSCELLPKTLPQVMLRFRQNLADPQKISDPISPHAHTHPCTPFVAQHVQVFGESFEVVKPLLDIDSRNAQPELHPTHRRQRQAAMSYSHAMERIRTRQSVVLFGCRCWVAHFWPREREREREWCVTGSDFFAVGL